VGNLIGTIFGPIGTIFHAVFYEPIYNILMLLYNLIHGIGVPGAFGLSIIGLTLLVRCCMIPLTRKQLKSSRAMQELAPQLNALKVQYRGDPQGMMKAQQDLYKEHGVSPVSGCLPLLIQMPFLYALLFAFKTLLTNNLHEINADIYSFLPHLTALPNPYFLWVNLGHPDPLHILPFLAAIFTLIQLRMAMPVRKKAAPGTPTDPTMQATQTTMYIMPVITFVIGLNFAAGLALYWTVGAMFASVQQYFLAGWGSLFLGIPGFEHLVPPPKELPSSTVSLAGSSRAGTVGARGLVASPSSSPASAPEGGLRGFFRQLREMGATATMEAETAAKARTAAKAGGNAVVDADETVPSGNGRTANANGVRDAAGSGNGTGSAANRRLRANAKAAPMLVKPASTSELPEQAIQREGTDSPPKLNGTLPEVEVLNVANGSNGASGSSKNGVKANAGNARTGTARVAASGNGTMGGTRPAGAKGNQNGGNSQRKSTNGSSGKGSSAGNSGARNRSGNYRAKGGR